MVDLPTPESPSPSPEPVGSVSEELFTLPPEFQRDASAPLADEFGRLVRMCRLKKKTKLYKSARRLFYGKYAAAEFEEKFGKNERSLLAWQKLCSHLRIGENLGLGSITDCQMALRGNYVNLIDLLDTLKTNDPPRIFSSGKELAKYIRNSGKIFPIEEARYKPLLSAFLIEVTASLQSEEGDEGRGTIRKARKGKKARKGGQEDGEGGKNAGENKKKKKRRLRRNHRRRARAVKAPHSLSTALPDAGRNNLIQTVGSNPASIEGYVTLRSGTAPFVAERSQYSDDAAEATTAYFDEHAEKLEQQHVHARHLSIMFVDALRNSYHALLNKERTEALDYACGTGVVSFALRPYVKRILRVDISQASVDIYNRRAAEGGLSQEMEAVCATLKGEPGELDDAKFDLITCLANSRQMPPVDQETRTLAHFLKPGGSLLVAEIKAASDRKGMILEDSHTHGFTEEQMRTAFEEAGLVDFELKDMPPIKMARGPTGQGTVWFIARGVKPIATS